MKILKQVFILLLFLLNIKTGYSQIQLSQNDVYAIGEYKINNAQLSFFIPGKAGENQIWDFSNLKESYIELRKIEPYKNDGSAKDADITESVNGLVRDYYKKTNSGIYTVTGNKEGGFQNLKFMSFPATYGQINIDSVLNISSYKITGDTIDSLRVTTKIKIHSITDAWGLLKIPNAQFNSLRLKMKITYQIKQEGKKGSKPYSEIPGSFASDTFVNYQWYTQNKGYCVLNYLEKRYVKYLYIEPAAMDNRKKSQEDITVSNPINSTLKIRNSGNDNYKIALFDMTGKQVVASNLDKNALEIIDVSFFNAGIYNLQLYNVATKSVSFQKLIK